MEEVEEEEEKDKSQVFKNYYNNTSKIKMKENCFKKMQNLSNNDMKNEC